MSEDKKETAYARWYANHKKELSAKRKERYRTDPEYRQKCLDRKAKQLEKKNYEPVPEQYTHNLSQVAEALGVTLWTMRRWRSADYFPAPFSHTLGRFFTTNQVALLNLLVEFFEQHGKAFRAGDEEAKTSLENLAALIRANWEQ